MWSLLHFFHFPTSRNWTAHSLWGDGVGWRSLPFCCCRDREDRWCIFKWGFVVLIWDCVRNLVVLFQGGWVCGWRVWLWGGYCSCFWDRWGLRWKTCFIGDSNLNELKLTDGILRIVGFAGLDEVESQLFQEGGVG